MEELRVIVAEKQARATQSRKSVRIIIGSLLLAGSWTSGSAFLAPWARPGTFIATVTVIPFMPEGWDVAAGGFPAMTDNVPFLMKDVVLLAVSLYFLRQDAVRLTRQ
ncbi:DUF417 family protein [Bradyrhizobium sp. AZCC 1693]|uniref:DUF417 family protein n=1 Tax=Bradyrhizobium sp. AZCC 1693 TaxID=3117029 RepID=UPI002FEEAA68